MHESADALASDLLTLITRHPEGLRASELQARAAIAGRRPRLDAVTAGLLTLQRQNLAGIDAHRRWHLRIPGTAIPASATGEVHAPPAASRGPVLAALPAHGSEGEAWTASAPIHVQAGEQLHPSWAMLRDLLPYYAEALARNERAQLLGASERYGEQFLLVAPGGRWWPTQQEKRVLDIGRAHLPAAFLTALSRRAREPVYIAYPLALVHPKDPQRQPFLLPVTTLAAEWTLDADRLRVILPAQTPAIEWRWASGQRQRGHRIRELLDALDVQADDEAWQAGSFVDWPSFVERLAGAVPADLRTALDPARPVRELDCGGPAGLYGALGLFLSSELQYARGAVRDLLALGQWSDAEFAATALAPLFTAGSNDGGAMAAAATVPVMEPLALGEDQLDAVRDGLNAPLTVVTGPPGTGKSQVAVAVLASAALSGRSVLFASRNHQAIEAVAGRLTELLAHQPLLIRANARDGGEGISFARAIDAILARPGAEARREQLAESITVLSRLDAARMRALDTATAAALAAEELGRLEATIADREAALGIAQGADLPSVPIPMPAPTPRGWLMRGFAPWLRRLRLRRLRRIALDWQRLGLAAPDESTLELHEQRLAALTELAELRRQRAALEASVRAGTGAADLEDPVRLGERMQASALQQLQTLAGVLAECAPTDRQALTALRGDVVLANHDGTAGAARLRERWAAQRTLILGHMPLWAVSNLGAASRIPLVPGLFDYVVIDEAAQCDIASALPLLARARRAIVIGDPAQLPVITQVPVAWEVQALRAAGRFTPGIGSYLYSANSLFHLAAAADTAKHHLLRDHYRCHEDIADYISATFYGRRLRPLTDPQRLQAPAGQRAGFHWTPVHGPLLPARTGCAAPAEIDAIAAELQRLLVDEGYAGSVGVVTPFREQANRLRDRLERSLPAGTIARARLEVHTAHGFQGNARDLMLFSLCAGADLPAGARAFLRETGHLVNVAVSRARAVCHVFGDLDYAARCGIPHLEALLARRRTAPAGPAGFESPWEERLHRALAARGVQTIAQYPVAGRRLDLALLSDAVKLDIEVDGDRYHRDPDGRRKAADLWRDHQLRALGWRVVRFWVYELRENMDECVERVIAGTRPAGP